MPGRPYFVKKVTTMPRDIDEQPVSPYLDFDAVYGADDEHHAHDDHDRPARTTKPNSDTVASETLDRLRSRLVTGADVIDLPKPTALVDGVLFTPSTALIYGPPKVGKSLAAVDLGCSVAAGVGWQGRTTTAGRVLYVVAEGVGGLGKRVDAWLKQHDIDRPKLAALTWLTQAVNLSDWSAVEGLARIVDELKPSLIVLDTLARCMVGADENAAKDMGNVVAALDRLRDVCGSCVVPVHHMGKNAAAGARGSNALLGAVDTAVEMTGDAQAIRISVVAQKDAPCIDPFWCRLIPVANSVVLIGAVRDDEASTSAVAALDTLKAIATSEGMSTSTWEAASELSHSSFYRARKWLVDHALVVNVGTGRTPRYVPGAVEPGTDSDAF
jgi:hypothetical protein